MPYRADARRLLWQPGAFLRRRQPVRGPGAKRWRGELHQRNLSLRQRNAYSNIAARGIGVGANFVRLIDQGLG